MCELSLSVQDAFDHVGTQYSQIPQTFRTDMKALPDFPAPLDRLAADYVAGMGLSVYTNVKWSFATKRYFGKEGRAVEVHRRLILLDPGAL